MENRQKNIESHDGNNENIYMALVLTGAVLICSLSFFYPVSIILMLFLMPMAFQLDVYRGKPIISIGMGVVIGIFIFFNQFNYSLYIILTAFMGVVVFLNYIVFKYLKVDKFSEGLIYSALFSLTAGIITAIAVFLLRGQQSFSLEIVDGIKGWIANSNRGFVNTTINMLYNYDYMLTDSKNYTMLEFIQGMSGSVDYGSALTKAEKIEMIMPYIEEQVNIYAISSLLLYPAFCGIITWWRGNYRYYKDVSMTKDAKILKPKPFSTFAVPRKYFGIIAVMLLLSFILQVYGNNEVVYNATLIMQNFAYIILAVQGFAIMEYFLKRVPVFRYGILRVIVIMLLTAVTAGGFPVFLGAVDLFINIRFVYAKSKEIKEKLKKNNIGSRKR